MKHETTNVLGKKNMVKILNNLGVNKTFLTENPEAIRNRLMN